MVRGGHIGVLVRTALRVAALLVAVVLGSWTPQRAAAQSAAQAPRAPTGLRIAPDGGVAPPLPPPYSSFYSPSSPWNTLIPADARADLDSPSMVQSVVTAAQAQGFLIAVKQWSWTLYHANASTPRYDVAITTGWAAPYTKLAGVPIPNGAVPDPAGDGHMIIISDATGCEYDFWQLVHRGDGSWATSWANATTITGSGWYPRGGSATGSGSAGAAGLIRPEEMQAGHIDHALSFAYPYTKAGGPVLPATQSDGTVTSAGAIPEGARLQLDPAVDLSTLGLKPYELIIARALQQYGLYLMDAGGGVTMAAQNPLSTTIQYPWGDQTFVYLPLSLVSGLRVLTLGPQYQPNTGLDINACASFQ